MILVAVESDVLRQRLVEMLHEMGEDSVVSVNKVRDAVRCLQSADFAMVITDIRLSDGTGFDVIASIPDKGVKTRIVMLMPYLLTPYTMEAKKRGAHMVLEHSRLLQGMEALAALLRSCGQVQDSPSLADATEPSVPSEHIEETAFVNDRSAADDQAGPSGA